MAQTPERRPPRSARRGVPLLIVVGVLVALLAVLRALADDERPDDEIALWDVSRTVAPPRAGLSLPNLAVRAAEAGVSEDVRELPSVGEVAALPVPDPEPLPHVRRGNRSERMYVPDEAFAAKYAEATLAEILVAKFEVEQQVQAQMQALPEARFAAGLAETSTLPRPKTWEEAEAQSVSHGDGLLHATRTEGDDPEWMTVQRTSLPWDEYTGYYDLQDELSWLGREVRRRQESP